MSVNLRHAERWVANSNIVRLHIIGRLTVEDYGDFVPHIEAMIRKHEKIRIIFDMIDFRGWTLAALWHDVKFDLQHCRHIERIAMIAKNPSEHGLAIFCRPFASTKFRFFNLSELAEMEEWIAVESRALDPA